MVDLHITNLAENIFFRVVARFAVSGHFTFEHLQLIAVAVTQPPTSRLWKSIFFLFPTLPGHAHLLVRCYLVHPKGQVGTK